MRVSVEREGGTIYLAMREIGGTAMTLKLKPGASNSISALLFQAAQSTEDFQGAECTVLAELEFKSEKSSPIP